MFGSRWAVSLERLTSSRRPPPQLSPQVARKLFSTRSRRRVCDIRKRWPTRPPIRFPAVRDVVIAGDGVRLLLRVSAYQRPSLESGADANWLSGEAELAADLGGSFRARRGVSLRTEELAAFRDALRRLLDELDGEATLSHMEDEVGCTIRLRRGTGELDAFVREHVPGVELRVERVRTNQSYLQETARQFDALVSDFPVKGDALG